MAAEHVSKLGLQGCKQPCHTPMHPNPMIFSFCVLTSWVCHTQSGSRVERNILPDTGDRKSPHSPTFGVD